MNDSITASPLSWPHHIKRTLNRNRVDGRFSTKTGSSWAKPLTLNQAVLRVRAELERYTKSGRQYRCHPDSVIISTDLALRLDGLPRSGQGKPDDPGAAVYFKFDGEDRCMPCDQYLRIEDNLAAIAATLAALRTIERHGSQMFNAAFTGFTALPGPGVSSVKSWRIVLEYDGYDLVDAKAAYRSKRSKTHTDHGGRDDDFVAVQQAWAEAQSELGVN